VMADCSAVMAVVSSLSFSGMSTVLSAYVSSIARQPLGVLKR
jgi:hypothetical protein